MIKKIVSVIIIIVLLVILVFVLKNNIIDNTKKILNNNINNLYSYINKYDFKDSGVVNITANYKGAHGSTNPVNFEYNFNIKYNDNKLNTVLENNDGYYENSISNDLLSIYMKIKNNDQLKDILSIKEIKEDFNTITFNFDESIINKVLNKNYKEFKLIVNTNIFYLGIKDYKLVLDNYILNITDDFKHFSNDDIRIVINNNGYNINYKDHIKLNYKNKEDKDYYSISIDECAFDIEIGSSINIKVNKEVNIYNGLGININFKDVKIYKNSQLNRTDIPLYRYFDNANINIGE